MGTALSVHSAVTEIYKKALAHDMHSERVDGKDVLAVREVVCQLAERTRAGEGPTLLEAVTYRYRGHSMADSDVQRPKEEIAEHKTRDPIPMYAESVLLKRNLVTQADLDQIQKDVEAIVEASVQFAEASPEPSLDTLYDSIYAQPVANMHMGGSLIGPATLYSGNGKHG
jgi:pyruvate dehydrogenase E1 component alpha subunit